MKLILIRHGDAGAYTTPDHERNLSKLGMAQAEQTGDFLRQYLQGAAVDLLISSPYNRAYQTAQVIAKRIDYQGKHAICDAITPDDDPRWGFKALEAMIDDDYECVVVVCHMPIITHLARLLTDNDTAGFGLAEVRIFEMAVLGLGQGVQRDEFCPIVSV